MQGDNLFSLRLTWVKNILFLRIILQNAEENFETLPSANSLCRTIILNDRVIECLIEEQSVQEDGYFKYWASSIQHATWIFFLSGRIRSFSFIKISVLWVEDVFCRFFVRLKSKWSVAWLALFQLAYATEKKIYLKKWEWPRGQGT